MEFDPIIRTVSGRGVIKIPVEWKKAKKIILYTQVVREVQTPSVNLSFNPSKSFYAHICFCKDDFVLQTYDVNFAKQMFVIWDGMQGQLLISLKCAVADILQREPQIQNHEHNIYDADTLKFDCFGTSALQLVLKGDKMDACVEEDNTPEEPPSPPPAPPFLPYDSPVEVSPAYDGATDGGSTLPAPGDVFENPNQGDACVAYTVVYSYDAISGGNTNRIDNQSIRLYGEIGVIEPTRDPNGDPQILIECQGLADFEVCGAFEPRGVSTLTGAGSTVEFANATIDSIT